MTRRWQPILRPIALSSSEQLPNPPSFDRIEGMKGNKVMSKFNTNYKYITILNTKYLIISPTTLGDINYPKETTDIRQFNWDNIPSDKITYSNN